MSIWIEKKTSGKKTSWYSVGFPAFTLVGVGMFVIAYLVEWIIVLVQATTSNS